MFVKQCHKPPKWTVYTVYTTHENGKLLGNIGDGSYCLSVRHISTNLIDPYSPTKPYTLWLWKMDENRPLVYRYKNDSIYLLTMVIFHFAKFNNQRI